MKFGEEIEMSEIFDAYSSGLFATLAYANLSTVVGLSGQQRQDRFKEELQNDQNNGGQFTRNTGSGLTFQHP